MKNFSACSTRRLRCGCLFTLAACCLTTPPAGLSQAPKQTVPQYTSVFSSPSAQTSTSAPSRIAPAGQNVPAPAASVLPAAWTSVGPDGGDARSLTPDPNNPRHLYLGTTSSWVYETEDAGKSWHRLARLGKGDDLIVDNILVDSSDPKTLIVGAFNVSERGGGIFISHNGGANWKPVSDMDGQSVRALTQAVSNPKVLVAGTVAGVFRSIDGGEHWAEISPAASSEVHEVESVAVDPVDTNTIYAGTWHLPWKTTDGGAHWSNIKEGLIDDSDVFSIIIDPHAPAVVYASACSGIYKSESAGAQFHKVQGIPSTARRTRVLMQDPANGKVVYAGTTEGLYKTADGGVNWSRLTGPDVIINDVFVDPGNDQHIMLATDRSGVLTSTDGGGSFSNSNGGFSQRVVQTVLVDGKQPGVLYAGVLNDKIYGGAFESKDNGASWQQQADGLAGRDVFVLAQAPDGVVYAGTNSGIARLVDGKWQLSGGLVAHVNRAMVTRVHGKRQTHSIDTVKKTGVIDSRVNQLDLTGSVWYAATAKGVYRSGDQGQSWEAVSLPPGDVRSVRSLGTKVVAAQRNSLMVSDASGQNWQPAALPTGLSGVNALALSEDGAVWIGGREGVYFSKDDGGNWDRIQNLPLGEIGGLDYDPQLKRVLVSSRTSTTIFGVDASRSPWKYWETGWRVHQVLQQGSRLVAASLYDGVVLEPRSGSEAKEASVSADSNAPGVQ